MNKLPIEIISQIMLFNRSKEAEIFIKAWGDAEKRLLEQIENLKKEGWNAQYLEWCQEEHRFYSRTLRKLHISEMKEQRLPLMFGIFKDTKKVTMAAIKKVCIENNFKKKTFKNKKEAWSYLIKNLN